MSKTKYIAIATQKGGAGKTTLTVLLASYLQYTRGLSVAIIDCDYPQHSIQEMRERDLLMISEDIYYRHLASKQFSKSGIKGYPIVEATFEDALDKADQLAAEKENLDYIFFDLPGTVNALGLIRVISSMDYIFTPITADRVVLESSIHFASIINERMITNGKSGIRGLYMVWNMVDRREKSDLYEIYEKLINEMGISIMESRIPDSKRFRRELSQLHRPIFRSTLFPIDRQLVKSSGVKEFTDEFLKILGDDDR